MLRQQQLTTYTVQHCLVPVRCCVFGKPGPTWQDVPLRYYISVEMPSATVQALMSGTEVLHQDFGKHWPDFLTVPFVYWADRPQLNRKGLVCVWSINQKFVKHKVAPNEGFTQARSPIFPAPFVPDVAASLHGGSFWNPVCIFITLTTKQSRSKLDNRWEWKNICLWRYVYMRSIRMKQ